MSIQFNLEDFFDYYVSEIDPSNNYKDVYPQEFIEYESKDITNFDPFYTSIPLKKEFSDLRTSQNFIADKFNNLRFKHQEFMSRFINPKTPYNRMLVFHTVGTGKCVHPSTEIKTSYGIFSIESIWEKYNSNEIIDAENGHWYTPSKPLYIYSFNTVNSQIELKLVLKLFRQKVKTNLKIYTTETGKEICCTFAHKLYDIENKIYTNKIDVGTKVAFFESLFDVSEEIIFNVETVNYNGWVYDFEVDCNHSYIANGFVTHNTCVAISVAETALKVDPSVSNLIILVPSPALKKNPYKNLFGESSCVGNKYEVSRFDEAKRLLSDKEWESKVKREINRTYTIQTYNEFAKKLAVLTDDEIVQKYTNSYIFIDEAHNLHATTKNNSEFFQKGKVRKYSGTKVSKYYEIHRLSQLVPNLKLLLLTGTPMLDSHTDMVWLLNLLNGPDKQITFESWATMWADSIFKNKESLFNYTHGKISYFKQANTNIVLYNAGDYLTSGDKSYLIKTTNIKMSDFQKANYLKAWEIDKIEEKEKEKKSPEDEEDIDLEKELEMLLGTEAADEEKASVSYKRSTAASNFIFPDQSYGLDGEMKFVKKFNPRGDEKREETKEEREKRKKEKKEKKERKAEEKKEADESKDGDEKEERYSQSQVANASITNDFYIKLTEGAIKDDNSLDREKVLKNIGKYGAKFEYVIRQILDARDKGEKIFIYTHVVNGGGAILLGALLKLFDYEWLYVTKDAQRAAKAAGPKPRFLVLTSETASGDQINDILRKGNIVNSKDNIHGEYVQVIIGTEVISEGVDLKGIRKVFIFNPWWNSPKLDQAIGRAVRADSHLDLPPMERNVTVYRLIAEPENPQDSIDRYVYSTTEDKDKYIKQIERILKEISVDCVINRERNKVIKGEENSRECDYQKCDWKCYGVPDILQDYEENRWGTIEDTYNLYYGEVEIEKIKESIQNLFLKFPSLTFAEIKQSLGSNVSNIVIARTLSEMIFKNDIIYNKLGFRNFLREENNLYFLVDDPAGTNLYTQAYYALNPVPNKKDEYINVLIETAKENLPSIIDSLNKTSSDLEKTKNKIEMLPDYVKSLILDEVQKVPAAEKSALAKTITTLYVKTVIREELISEFQELFNKYGFYGVVPIEQSDKDRPDLKIAKKILVAETLGGKEDIRKAKPEEEAGTKCGTGNFAKSYLPFLVFILTKKAIENNQQTPFSIDPSIKVNIKPLPLDKNIIEHIGKLDQTKSSIYQYLIKEKLIDIINGLETEEQILFFKKFKIIFDKAAEKLTRTAKANFQAKAKKSLSEKLDKNELEFILENIEWTSLRDLINEYYTNKEIISDFSQKLNKYSLEVVNKVLSYAYFAKPLLEDQYMLDEYKKIIEDSKTKPIVQEDLEFLLDYLTYDQLEEVYADWVGEEKYVDYVNEDKIKTELNSLLESFRTIDGSTFADEMRYLFGKNNSTKKDITADDICGILSKWFKEIKLLKFSKK